MERLLKIGQKRCVGQSHPVRDPTRSIPQIGFYSFDNSFGSRQKNVLFHYSVASSTEITTQRLFPSDSVLPSASEYEISHFSQKNCV